MNYFDLQTQGLVGYLNLPGGLKDGGTEGVGYFVEGAEFWHSYHENDPFVGSAHSIENRWPKGVPTFSSTIKKNQKFFSELSVLCLQALAIAKNAPANLLTQKISNGWSMHRVMRYPGSTDKQIGDQRVHAHKDVTILSMLFAGNRSGLEVYFDKKWIGIEPEDDDLYILGSEMLEHFTGGTYQSCFHRVIHKQDPSLPRTTLIYFSMPHPSVTLQPLTPYFNLSSKFSPISVLDYMEKKLLIKLDRFKQSA